MRRKLFATMAAVAFAGSVLAQNTEAMKVSAGGTFGKAKIMPKMERFALAQLTVNYKLTTTIQNIGKEKSTGKMAGAKLTAYLETTDGELTATDFQEVTDHFYGYFQKKLKSAGIDTVAWSKIAATDFYQSADEKQASNEEEKKGGQVWVTHNANKGNTMYGGGTMFTFGKAKKAGRFCEELDAPAGFLYVTVDFADIMLHVDIKTKSPNYPSGFYPYTKTTSFKYNAATKPNMKVTPSTLGLSLLWTEKMAAESLWLEGDIPSDYKYHTAVNQDKSRIKSGAFAFAKSMDPVVIETTRAEYKAAAKKALEKYADTFVAKAMELKK